MKRQQLITLIILVVVVGGLGLFLLKRENASWNTPDTRAGGKVLGEFPLNDVAKVHIKGATNEITLVKKDDIWTVQERDNYPANFSKVGEAIRKLWDIKVVQPQTATAETLSRFQLLPPGQGSNSATLVELKDKDGKAIAALRAGKKHMSQNAGGGFGGEWPDGRDVMSGEDVKTVALVKDALTDLEPQAEQWVDKDFFKVARIQSIDVSSPESTNNWSVTRESESGEWHLADLPAEKELDKTKTSSLGGLLASPYFNDLALGKKPEEMGFDHPRQVTIKTFDNFTYTVLIGATNSEGNYYVKVDVKAALPETREAKPDEKPEEKEAADKAFKTKQEELSTKLKKEQRLKDWTFIVAKWTVDPLLRSKPELIADKKPEVKPPTATPAVDTGANLFPDPTQPAPPAPPGLPKAKKDEAAPAPKPSDEKPAEPDKPAAEKPADTPKPAEQPKPAEDPKPEKPAEQPKPADEPKPAEPPK
jgi:hypothetical protein